MKGLLNEPLCHRGVSHEHSFERLQSEYQPRLRTGFTPGGCTPGETFYRRGSGISMAVVNGRDSWNLISSLICAGDHGVYWLRHGRTRPRCTTCVLIGSLKRSCVIRKG